MTDAETKALIAELDRAASILGNLSTLSSLQAAGAVREAQRRIAALEAALRAVQWHPETWRTGDLLPRWYCPYCRAYRAEGHAADCIVGQALTQPQQQEEGVQ